MVERVDTRDYSDLWGRALPKQYGNSMPETACLEHGTSHTAESAIYVGMRPSRTEGDNDYGHVWLVLGEEGQGCGGRRCRFASESAPLLTPTDRWIGYYPDLTQLPAEIGEAQGAEAVRAFARYFTDNAVPGMKIVDLRAQNIALRFPERIAWIGVFGDAEDLEGAVDRAQIPDGRKERTGRYGLNTALADVNNCVSWAADIVLNPSLPADSTFVVDNPPKVRSFMERGENMYCRSASAQ